MLLVLSACTPQLATDADERERLLLFATSAPEFREYIETGRRPLITGEREREKGKTEHERVREGLRLCA